MCVSAVSAADVLMSSEPLVDAATEDALDEGCASGSGEHVQTLCLYYIPALLVEHYASPSLSVRGFPT